MKEVLAVIAVAEVIGVVIGIFNTIMSLHYTKKVERRDTGVYKITVDRLQYICTNLEARLNKLEEKENKRG